MLDKENFGDHNMSLEDFEEKQPGNILHILSHTIFVTQLWSHGVAGQINNLTTYQSLSSFLHWDSTNRWKIKRIQKGKYYIHKVKPAASFIAYQQEALKQSSPWE